MTLESLEERIKHLEKTCCSVDNMKRQIKMQLLVETLNTEVKELINNQKTQTRFMYVLTGVYIGFQFLESMGWLHIGG